MLAAPSSLLATLPAPTVSTTLGLSLDVASLGRRSSLATEGVATLIIDVLLTTGLLLTTGVPARLVVSLTTPVPVVLPGSAVLAALLALELALRVALLMRRRVLPAPVSSLLPTELPPALLVTLLIAALPILRGSLLRLLAVSLPAPTGLAFLTALGMTAFVVLLALRRMGTSLALSLSSAELLVTYLLAPLWLATLLVSSLPTALLALIVALLMPSRLVTAASLPLVLFVLPSPVLVLMISWHRC